MIGSLRLACSVATIALVVACSVPELSPDSDGSRATAVTTGPVDSSTFDTGRLALEFVNWLFPIEAGEYELAAQTYAMPFASDQFVRVGACLATSGYRDIAAAIGDAVDSGSEVAGPGLYWTPDAPKWDPETELAEFPATAMLGNVDFQNPAFREMGVEFLARDLERNPRFGVQPDYAGELYDVMAECMTMVFLDEGLDSGAQEANRQAHLLMDQWMHILAGIDQDLSVAEALGFALECVRGISPEFEQTPDVVAWLSLADALAGQTPMTETAGRVEIHRRFSEFYECMAPVVAARRPLRIEAREGFIEENLVELLQLQHDIDQALEQLSR